MSAHEKNEAYWPSGESAVVTHRILLPGGERARVVEMQRAVGEPVLLLPGWGAFAYTFRFAMVALARAGYRPVTLELRGHGGSDKPRERAKYSLGSLRDYVLSAMDSLHLERVSVVGHSLGALVATHLAVHATARVARLALLAPVGFGRITGIKLFRRAHPAMAVLDLGYTPRWVVGTVLRYAYGTLRPPTAVDITEYWLPSRERGFQFALLSMLHEMDWAPLSESMVSALEARRMPILIVRGANDRVIRPLPDTASVAERLGARTLSIPRAGHVVPEEAPDAVHAALIPFLRE